MWLKSRVAVILLNEELRLHIKKLQCRSTIILMTMLLTIISIGFGLLFLFVPSFVSIIFFVVAGISIVVLVCISRVAKKEGNEIEPKPVIFNADDIFSFEKIVNVLENLTDKENQLATYEDVYFFRYKKPLKLRVILYKTDDFNKKEFDNAKARINKKANKELGISQKVRLFESGKMMRYNIIYTGKTNDELCQFISQNANRNLTRGEGIINIVIAGNEIMIPPLYGECDQLEISRYKDVIKFANQVLLCE